MEQLSNVPAEVTHLDISVEGFPLPVATLFAASRGDRDRMREFLGDPAVQGDLWGMVKKVTCLDEADPRFVSADASLECLYAEIEPNADSASIPLARTVLEIRRRREALASATETPEAVGQITGTPLAIHVIRECAYAINAEYAFSILDELRTLDALNDQDLRRAQVELETEAHRTLTERLQIDGGYHTLQRGVWVMIETHELSHPVPDPEVLAAHTRLTEFLNGSLVAGTGANDIRNELPAAARNYYEQLVDIH